MPIGIGGVVILFVLSLIFGRDLVSPVLQQQAAGAAGDDRPVAAVGDDTAGRSQGQRDRYMLGDLELTWAKLLGGRYQEAHVGAVSRRNGLRVRHGRERDGAVLLSG